MVTQAIQHYPILIDLAWRLVTISGAVELVTSDNPVVLYNQFMAFRGFGSNAGWAVKGLQVFFPISPNHLLLLFDRDVYRVGEVKGGLFGIRVTSDLEQLNRLQYVSALENVYFRRTDHPAFWESSQAKQYRRTRKFSMTAFPQGTGTERKESILRISREEVATDLDLSFVRVLKPAKVWREKLRNARIQPAVVVRNEQLVNQHREFIRDVESGKRSLADVLANIVAHGVQDGLPV